VPPYCPSGGRAPGFGLFHLIGDALHHFFRRTRGFRFVELHTAAGTASSSNRDFCSGIQLRGNH
jgi:hypothetical protein